MITRKIKVLSWSQLDLDSLHVLVSRLMISNFSSSARFKLFLFSFWNSHSLGTLCIYLYASPCKVEFCPPAFLVWNMIPVISVHEMLAIFCSHGAEAVQPALQLLHDSSRGWDVLQVERRHQDWRVISGILVVTVIICEGPEPYFTAL